MEVTEGVRGNALVPGFLGKQRELVKIKLEGGARTHAAQLGWNHTGASREAPGMASSFSLLKGIFLETIMAVVSNRSLSFLAESVHACGQGGQAGAGRGVSAI